MMKRALILGLGLSSLTILPAAAADLPVKARPALPPIVTVYNWSGCYIGGNAGGKWATTRDDVLVGAVPGSPAVTSSFDRATGSTFLGGGQVGCNWQAPGSNWVFGVEGDADWHRWTVGRTQPVTVSPLVVGDTFDVTSRWQASFRGRVGYAWDRWMLYATGGLAITEARVGSNFPIFVGAVTFPATSAVDTKTLLGATVGGGLEYAITNNWSVGVEGRYSWYGNQTFSGGTVAAVPVVGAVPTFLFAPVTRTVRLDTVEVTGRLNYKFDWGGPVVARY
jgi:outer membrane immunogenic protein